MSPSNQKATPDSGEWLSMRSEAQGSPIARAYIPRDKSRGFASEPAIDWRGSLKAGAVRAVAEKSLTLLPDFRCTCEIWADERTPEPRVFKQGTTDDIVGYVRDWSSRANVSLSFQHPNGPYPLIYVWGALRDTAGEEPTDEVGVKLDRGFISKGGGDVVMLLFDKTRAPALRTEAFVAFFDNFHKHATA
jgi:hypothetical protein